MRTIDLPPIAPTLMESTRAIGYSLEAAIADIIDNSITAKGSIIEINFFPIGEAYISILDNGKGMKSDEVTNAMQYGSKSPCDDREINDLGRYGLGLKTASLSQCKTLTVISVRDHIISGRRWDLDYVRKTGQWSLLVLEDEDMIDLPDFSRISSMVNGTLIIWQNLDRLSIGEKNFKETFGLKMDKVREHISLVFHRYLTGEIGLKKIDILINNAKITPKDPFLVKKSTVVMSDEIININGDKVVVRPYILPFISKMDSSDLRELGGKEGLRKQQGFYVYRNKRLLIWGTWFRMMPKLDLSKLARIQVDIPNSLDDLWTLDIKKSTAVPPESVRQNLVKIIEKVSEVSKKVYVYRGKKEVDKTKIHVWNRLITREEGIIYEINRNHPLVERFTSLGSETKNALESLLTQIEGNLPLTSLFIDLTQDAKIDNSTKIVENETIELLKSMLERCGNNDDKSEMFNKLLSVEPFSEYCEEIKLAMKNGEIYE